MHFRPWLLCLDVSELAARLASSPVLADGPGDDDDDDDDDGSIDPEVDEGSGDEEDDEDEDTLWARARAVRRTVS
jgi:hypothetical protein